VFKDHSALSDVECWGNDVPEGKLTSFPMAVQRKEDENVVFSWITWPSRDAGMNAEMADPRLKNAEMPFDGNGSCQASCRMKVSNQAACLAASGSLG
jgi:uncharacterized protein YbaA (DUF1428 family)